MQEIQDDIHSPTAPPPKKLPLTLFDLLSLFPLKSQMSGTVFCFFFQPVILSLDPSLLVQIQIPAHPAPSSAVIGGDSSPSVMHGLVRQSRFVVMPSSGEGGGGEEGGHVLIQPVGRRRGRGDKTVPLRQQKYLQHSSGGECF